MFQGTRGLGACLGLLLCLSIPASARARQTPVEAGAPQTREQTALVEEQELLTRKLSRVVASMNRLADRFEAEGRVHAAKLLRDGLQHISQRHEGTDGLTLEERMTGSHEKLRSGQSMQSIETQQQIIGELEALISILMDRPDLDQLESEIERVQRQRRELQALASEETALREATEALREESSNDAQRELEAGLQQAQREQRELLAENERQSRNFGALDLERLEQELDALLQDQHTDAEVFGEWEPAATEPIEEALERLARARREETRRTRLQKAAETLRAAGRAQDANAEGRALEERAEAARRAARASGEPSAQRTAEALERAAESLRQAGDDEEARAQAAAELAGLAKELEDEARDARSGAAAARAEARQALEPLEQSASAALRELVEELNRELEGVDAAGSEARAESDPGQATERAHRDLRQALEQTKFLGQALGASQAENAERGETLRQGIERLPEDLGQAGRTAQEALKEARDAMREAAQGALERDPTAGAEAARRAEESLRKAQAALARERARRSSEVGAPGAQKNAELAEAQEALAEEAERLGRLAPDASLGQEAREELEAALEEAAQSMRQAASEMRAGKNASAAQSQRRAGEALQRAAQEARQGVEPQTEEERQQAEQLAREQERIEKELYEFREQYEKERSESSPDLASLPKAQASAGQAKQSLQEGDLDQAAAEEQQAEREIQQALAELAQEEEQYQKLREEELLFQIAEEVAAILEAHELARLEALEVEQGRDPPKPVTRGQKLRLRKIARDEEALATRAGEIGKAIREEGSLVTAELIERVERDLSSIARSLGDQGGYRSDERVQALQADVSHYLTWLAEALEEERERREDQEPPPGDAPPPPPGENRLVPDVAELKLLSRMEIDVLDSIEELLVLYPELEQADGLDPLLLEEIQRLAHRHERSTELFREFRQRLGIDAPRLELDGSSKNPHGGQPETDAGDTEE
jgi:hypothetical protein